MAPASPQRRRGSSRPPRALPERCSDDGAPTRQEVRALLPPTTRELDACGIGFVADARGRSARAIVAAALDGLACVKHRGAVAADARTADGSGLLLPIPRALFGHDTGVAVLFLRGGDPPPPGGAAPPAAGRRLPP